MTVNRNNTEIFNQSHKMWAEGTSDVEPKVNDIEITHWTELLPRPF